MKAKDIIIDFINHLFLLFIVAFFIFWFIVGDRFEAFTELMRSLVPVGIFGFIFLVMIKIKRMKLKERRRNNEEDAEIVLRLSYFDESKGDILIFLLPIIILLVAFFIDGAVSFSDIIQAVVAFILMYLWKSALFKKRD